VSFECPLDVYSLGLLLLLSPYLFSGLIDLSGHFFSLNMLLILTILALGSPCGTYDAYRKHGHTNIPQLAAACAIEHATISLRDWPPTNPHVQSEYQGGFGGGDTTDWTSPFDKWANENSSPAAHQALQTELADMCSYALATDFRFVGDYCSAPTEGWPSYFAFREVLDYIDRSETTAESVWKIKLAVCNYALAQGISGTQAQCLSLV
jgi:hypothetical protein